LYGAAHWRLTGFTVAGAKKGIMIDASPFVTIDGVEVRDIGDEGVHFRRSRPTECCMTRGSSTPDWRNRRGDASDLGGVGKWAIDVTSTSKCAGNPNIVYASSTVTRATSGLTSIAVTP
jgi:hypothetical protein